MYDVLVYNIKLCYSYIILLWLTIIHNNNIYILKSQTSRSLSFLKRIVQSTVSMESCWEIRMPMSDVMTLPNPKLNPNNPKLNPITNLALRK